MENPTVTSLESSNVPSSQVPFPGISICNINKISRRKAIQYATDLSNLTKIRPDILLKHMKLLGYMYEFYTPINGNLAEFQKILDAVGIHPKSLIKQLAPKCQDILLKCSWADEEVTCSDYFEFTLTFEGYCCLFNYQKHVGANRNNANDVKFQKISGMRNGLTIFLKNDLDDYFYANVPSKGVNVHVFDPRNFPDMTSGSFNSILVGAGTETLVDVSASLYSSSEGILRYPLEKRQCYFGFEKGTDFGEYSESDCILSCRIKAMKRLCECVPFQLSSETSYVCTLIDIPCLSQHRIKWNAYSPHATNTEALAPEIESGLKCDFRCYPTCKSVLYELSINSQNLFQTENDSKKRKTRTLIHIFFKNAHVRSYRQSEVFVWFEILANFGGLFSLTVGLSIISIIEIILFCIKCVFVMIKNK
ncbi:hypothetical protein JTB14_020630 [Gonioctena quinquepunctata]|nr:hypothetical protein JTB14_020630 [Gonioctena quinquepunctata]